MTPPLRNARTGREGEFRTASPFPTGCQFRVYDRDMGWSDWTKTTRAAIVRMHDEAFYAKLMETDGAEVLTSEVDGIRRQWRKRRSE